MAGNGRARLRNDAIVAFLSVVAASVVLLDETGPDKMTAEEFLVNLDLALNGRLSKPDGAALDASVRKLCGLLGIRVRRMKSQFAMKRAIDEIFDEFDSDNTD